MIDQLTRQVDDLTQKNEELVAASASPAQIEESMSRLERAEAQRERAEEELRRAEEKRHQAEQLTALVQQQVAQLTDELERLRQQSSGNSEEIDRTEEDTAQALEDQAADIDQALARAAAVNDGDDQVIRRISAEISDDTPTILGEEYSSPRAGDSQTRVISGGFEPAPPHDLSAERVVLGCMMLSADASADVVEVVTSLDFYYSAHAEIFDEISVRRKNGDLVEVGEIAETLQGRESHQLNWFELLTSLLDEAPEDLLQAEVSAEVVHERAVLRRLIAASSYITQLSYHSKTDVQELIDLAQAEIQAVALHRGPQDYAPLGDIMESTLDDIEGIGNQQGRSVSGLATGFSDLDTLINGLPIGKLTVVAGEAGVGKTTFGIDLIRACSLRWQSGSLLFSLQMNRNEIATRILSAEARVAIHRMMSGRMTDDDWTRLARVMPQVTNAPLYIDDSSSPPLEEITAKSRRLVRSNDVKLIVVDSAQLIGHHWSTAEELRIAVHKIARELRMLARDLNVPIVAISELEIPAGRSYLALPTVDDLQEWKILEQNADLVILLNRDDLKERESPRAGEADFVVTKNRSGPTGTIVNAFQGHYCRFVDMAKY
ncbi:DnaB-like helicase C-terminal domain-containing protein [Streptomyces sp. NPDC056512]|uniref:DnaB-like helicase C-terminal domain-containing protein n=1 Tax=Streptomyces sp. NPDC056512 TaxID=3345846 RepID=UPI0036BA9FC0